MTLFTLPTDMNTLSSDFGRYAVDFVYRYLISHWTTLCPIQLTEELRHAGYEQSYVILLYDIFTAVDIVEDENVLIVDLPDYKESLVTVWKMLHSGTLTAPPCKVIYDIQAFVNNNINVIYELYMKFN